MFMVPAAALAHTKNRFWWKIVSIMICGIAAFLAGVIIGPCHPPLRWDAKKYQPAERLDCCIKAPHGLDPIAVFRRLHTPRQISVIGSNSNLTILDFVDYRHLIIKDVIQGNRHDQYEVAAISNDRRSVAVGVKNDKDVLYRDILLCDSANLTELCRWNANDNRWIESLAFSDDGKYLASHSGANITIWRLSDRKGVVSITVPDGFNSLSDIVSYDDGFAIVLCHRTLREIGIYMMDADSTHLTRVAVLPLTRKGVERAWLFPDNNRISVTCTDRPKQAELLIYEIGNEGRIASLGDLDIDNATHLQFSPDLQWVAVADRANESISIWDLRSNDRVCMFKGFCGLHAIFFADEQTLLALDRVNLTAWNIGGRKGNPIIEVVKISDIQ